MKLFIQAYVFNGKRYKTAINRASVSVTYTSCRMRSLLEYLSSLTIKGSFHIHVSAFRISPKSVRALCSSKDEYSFLALKPLPKYKEANVLHQTLMEKGKRLLQSTGVNICEKIGMKFYAMYREGNSLYWANWINFTVVTIPFWIVSHPTLRRTSTIMSSMPRTILPVKKV